MALDQNFFRLLTDLLTEFRGSDAAYPRLQASQFGCARSLLRALVTDHDTVEAYMHLVGDRLNGQTPPPDISYEEQCFGVIEKGVEAIAPDALSTLLLDPVGIMNIHLAVERDTPPIWARLLAANGKALREQHITPGLPKATATGSGVTPQPV